MHTVFAENFIDHVIPLINDAKESVKIAVYDWRWYPDDIGNPVSLFNQSLVRARNRAVDIRAVVNSDVIARALREVKIDVKKYQKKELMHVKLILIDDKILVTGSHNLTVPGLSRNHELSTISDDTEACRFAAQLFSNLWLS